MPSAFFLPTQSNYSFTNPHALKTAVMLPGLLLKIWTNSRTYLSALFLAAFLATGCGGTPDHPVNETPGNTYSQTSNASYAAAATASSASSFTVNPTENFNGFNPEIWNSQQSWVECNCGNNKTVEPQIMTWNPDA